ncbi:hypothetical protein CLI75_11855, partial [Porphyromonas gingivalis]
HSLLRRINACVCLDQYEGIEELLCKGLFFILLSVKLGQLGNSICKGKKPRRSLIFLDGGLLKRKTL